MTLVTCLTFRAADNKRHSDISRNWGKIETVVPEALTHGVIFDPQDSGVYVIGLKGVDTGQARRLLPVLDTITDEKDNRPLFGETDCRTMHAEHFIGHSYALRH